MSELALTSLKDSPNIQLYWKMEGNANDSSGKGRNGSTTGIAFGSRYGRYLQGASGGGSSAQISSSFTFQPNTFSVSFWLRPTGFANYNNRISSLSMWGGFVFHTTSNGSVYCGTDVNTRFTPTQLGVGTLNLNILTHYCYTYDGTHGRFYKNGVLLAGPTAHNKPLAWNGFVIGGTRADNALYGCVDDVIITDNCLSVSEILELADLGNYPVPSVNYLSWRGKSRIKLGGVQEAKPFKPTDVSGCRLWIDPSELVEIDGNSIELIKDKSGYGNDLYQTAVGQRPIFKVNQLNGLPTLRLVASSSTSFHIPFIYNAPITVFYVGRLGATKARVLSGLFGNWLMAYHGGYENQAYFEGWIGATNDVVGTTNHYVWSAIVDSTSYLWKNGTLVKSGTGGVTAPHGFTIGYDGTSQFSDGDVGEIIAYNRALTEQERQSVENYLRTKWGTL